MQSLIHLIRPRGCPSPLLWVAILSILPGLANAQSRGASLIPEDRRMDWKPGVPGGIPVYPVFANVKAAPYSAKGDGAADDTAAIQKALDDCPEGKAVYLPAGTYRLTATLTITKGIVLRGEGPEKTRLINEATARHAIAASNYDNETVTKIVKGSARGSTSITVDDASRLRAGDLLLIDQLNDPDIVSIEGEGGTCRWAGRENGKRAMGQLVELVKKDGNTLTLSRPLAITFSESLEPQALRTSDKVIRRAGIEDLYVETTKRRTDESNTIRFWNAMYCWVKNVESSRCWFDGHVTLKKSLGCEIRDSYFHHAYAYGSGHGYGVLITAQSTDTLVENNTCYYLNTGPQAACSGPGNVIAYNFQYQTWGRDFPDTDWAHMGLSQHAAHPFLNLWEGNVVGTVGFDFYWGSSSHNTLFRNAVDMKNLRIDGRPMSRNLCGFRFDKFSRFNNAIGNVLGYEGMKGEYEADESSPLTVPTVWVLGIPDDPKVAATLLRHGNFDWVTKQTQWDPKIKDHKLPESLYLPAKPAWFGKLPWPPIGPDAKPMSGTIPARERWLRIPAAEREAQDLLYLGEFHLAAGKRDEAQAAFKEVVEKFPATSSAPAARTQLEKLK
ncbi:MAG: glycosyl hydrolase family 28-related protein [Planctomycetota bacterium]